MKLHYLTLALLSTLYVGHAAAADVGISVQIGEPNFFGRIDIGRFPQPQVIYARPVVIERIPYGVSRPPVYLRVPPGHQKNWRRYCGRYHACGEPVYFVKDTWYRNDYAPRYREYRRDHREERREERHENNHGHDHDRGHGNGHDNRR
jgi:hypothetical protein